MKRNKKIKLLLIFSIVILLSCILIWYSYETGICTNKYKCYEIALSIGRPGAHFFLILSLLLYVLSLFKQEVIASWYKLTVLIPFALVWVFTTPTFCGGIICADRNFVAWVSASIFSLISIIFVVVKTLRHKI